jgi:hypothetical protein
MKKILTALLFLATSHIFGELPKGDVALISITGVGLQGIGIQQAKIEKENGKTFIDLSHLGKAELISSQAGNEFYALYLPKIVTHDGKEFEDFSVKIFTIKIAEDGLIYCSLFQNYPGRSEPRTTRYLLKSGKLK